MIYCTDVDLLHWEPNLFRDAAFASQLQLAGTGDLNGTTFTLDAGSLAAAHVAANQVIVLTGTVSGSYPIVSIDGATQLTLSVMYDGLYPETGAGVASPVGTALDLGYAIRTFWPQRKVVSDLLTRAAGIGPETDAPAVAQVVNTEALRRPCVLGTLQMIYSALAAAAAEPANFSTRAELYERLYRRALAQTRVRMDLDGDGREDATRMLSVVELKRL
jgi:hypothetical protein